MDVDFLSWKTLDRVAELMIELQNTVPVVTFCDSADATYFRFHSQPKGFCIAKFAGRSVSVGHTLCPVGWAWHKGIVEDRCLRYFEMVKALVLRPRLRLDLETIDRNATKLEAWLFGGEWVTAMPNPIDVSTRIDHLRKQKGLNQILRFNGTDYRPLGLALKGNS